VIVKKYVFFGKLLFVGQDMHRVPVALLSQSGLSWLSPLSACISVLLTWEVNKGDKLSTSSLLTSRQSELKENDRCLTANSSGPASKKEIAVFVGIYNCALGAADSICNEGLLENGIPKVDTLGLSQLNTICVLDDSETTWHNTNAHSSGTAGIR